MEDVATVWFPAVHIFDDFLPTSYYCKESSSSSNLQIKGNPFSLSKIKWFKILTYLVRYFTNTCYKEWKAVYCLYPFSILGKDISHLKAEIYMDIYIYTERYTYMYIYYTWQQIIFKGKYMAKKKRSNLVMCWGKSWSPWWDFSLPFSFLILGNL